MTDQYEKVMDLWKAGKFFDSISYFSQWMSEGLLGQEEIENFYRNLAEFWGFIEVECQNNVEVLFSLYEMIKKERDWDDAALCRKLRISQKAIEDIKNRRKPRSDAVGLKMLYELFPQMAV